jgi:hypothetical protein
LPNQNTSTKLSFYVKLVEKSLCHASASLIFRSKSVMKILKTPLWLHKQREFMLTRYWRAFTAPGWHAARRRNQASQAMTHCRNAS